MTDSSLPVVPAPAPAPPAPRSGLFRWLHRYHLLPLVVLAASLAVTHQLSRSSREHALHEMRASFDFSVREATTRIEQRMAAYLQVLQSVDGLMSHGNQVSRQEFHNFVEKLKLDENFPGIQAVSFAQILPAAQKEQHLAAIRGQGFADYAIHPGGERARYTPVIYIEPFSGRNLRAFGHDPYAQPERRSIMELARDLDQPVMTGKLTLVQENDKDVQAGFLIYLPVFKVGTPHRSVEERRANIIGWVSAPFRMADLMNGLHGEQASNLDIEIFDGNDLTATALMYDPDHDHVDGKASAGLFQTVRQLQIANHSWTMRVRTLPAFDARLDRDSERIVASSGIGISLLLSLLTLMLVNGRERALRAARQMNRELIDSESRYRQMFEDTTSIAFLLDPDSGRIVDANPAAAAFWGYALQQLRTMHIAEINTAPREQILTVLHAMAEGKRSHIEWRHLLKNGEIRDVEVFSGPLAYQGKVLLYSILHDISDRKQAEQALQESEARSREIAATLGEGLFVTDRSDMITFSNPEAQRLLGWTESVLLGQNRHELLHHSRPDGTPYPVEECEINQVLSTGRAFRSHDEAFWRKDGSLLPVSVNAAPIIRNQQIVGSVVAFHDIVERKKYEQALTAESTKNAMLLRTASDGIHVLDTDGRIVLANDAFCRMLGYSPEQLQGMHVTQWDAQYSAAELQELITRLFDQDQIFETRHRCRDGRMIDVEIHACGVAIDGERLLYASARDITERKKAADRVHHLANYDLLTDLPNRALLHDRLQQALAKARRDGARMALMFLDLDKFKPVNDTLGHNVGDLLLKEVAQRIQCCVRESDTVARVGGDEFVVLLPSIDDAHAARMVAQKILSTLEQPFQLSNHQLHISASIGIAIYPEHGEDEHLLTKSADQAMYAAKHGGGSALVSYEDLDRPACSARS
jgi:diguanylate cyclase (GGDEF)-like protein/PAS domain S-box-containing protein